MILVFRSVSAAVKMGICSFRSLERCCACNFGAASLRPYVIPRTSVE